MTKIVPALLVKTVEEYNATLRKARQLTNRFHIDIIDGKYVDNLTIMPRDIQKQVDNKMDMHLMVEDPVWFARECISLNPHIVIIQYESPGDVVAALELVVKSGFRAGLAINPETSVDMIKKLMPIISYVQIMGYPAGFAGTKFERSVLEKPAQVRAINPAIEVGLDGGVNGKTITGIAKAEFDVINVNSFLFDNPELDTLSAYSLLLEKTL
ncbi:hypothetical protein H0W80_02580 [Candidatus Saccharibacteria bacterium]|nr:hypothetical protein [Candidatus Saccharibacteria bacterium]